MYDFPEVRGATDALWAALAVRLKQRGVAAPMALTRGEDLHAVWTSPNLLLAQTCGYPLVTSLAGLVRLVATPCYSAPGCEGPLYRSAVVVRAADPARQLSDLWARRCAVNDMASNSGWVMLRAAMERGRDFASILLTGSHAASIDAVAQGLADVASIDCVTWAHLQRLRPQATRSLRVLAWTPPSPGLPLITTRSTDEATCQALLLALDEAASDPTLAPHRATLLLEGFERLSPDAYDTVADQAAAIGSAPTTHAGTP